VRLASPPAGFSLAAGNIFRPGEGTGKIIRLFPGGGLSGQGLKDPGPEPRLGVRKCPGDEVTLFVLLKTWAERALVNPACPGPASRQPDSGCRRSSHFRPRGIRERQRLSPPGCRGSASPSGSYPPRPSSWPGLPGNSGSPTYCRRLIPPFFPP